MVHIVMYFPTSLELGKANLDFFVGACSYNRVLIEMFAQFDSE